MSTTHASPDAPTFAALGVGRDLVRALQRRGIETAFPIQSASLPDSLAGRDVLGKGRTGSGKTVAFALPLVQRLAGQDRRRWPGRPRALVLVPTRELAIQVAETVDALAAAVGLRTMTILGGVRYSAQVRRLERGVDIVIATPGRLEDLLTQGVLTLRDVAMVVVDEADLMADMGFLPPVTRLLEQVPPGQRMLFSATLDGDVQVLVDRFLSDPLVHAVDEEQANAGVHHHLFLVNFDNKREVLTELVTGAGRTLLFVRTRTFAEKLAAELTDAGIPAGALHGDLRQGARQRNLSAFADGTVGVLVATDIAARGLHVDDIGLVVHVDPPTDPKAFLHRSGRTARAGAEGAVVTLATRNQNKTVKLLMAQARIKPIQHVVAPGDEVIAEVRAPRVAPRAAGRSLFEPDPDEVVLDDEPGRRGPRTRDERPGGRGERFGERRAAGPREGRRAPGPRPDRVNRRGDQDERAAWRDRDERAPRRDDRDDRRTAWREVSPGDRVARRRADQWEAFEEDRRANDREERADRRATPGQGSRPEADPWGRKAAAAASGRPTAPGAPKGRGKGGKAAPPRPAGGRAKTLKHKRR